MLITCDEQPRAALNPSAETLRGKPSAREREIARLICDLIAAWRIDQPECTYGDLQIALEITLARVEVVCRRDLKRKRELPPNHFAF